MEGKKVNLKDLYLFIIRYFQKNGLEINHLKLQKLLYYIQAWHLVYFEKNPLFDECPEAWVNGPVYRTVFNDFKKTFYTRNQNIKLKKGMNIDIEFQVAKDKLELNSDQWEFLDAVIENYGLMPHEKLVFLTHSEDPWNIAREGLNPFESSDNIITFDSMYNYYQRKLKKDLNKDELIQA